jgi:oligopeptide transport system substrate-binding protein
LDVRLESAVPDIGPAAWISDYPDPDSFLRVAIKDLLQRYTDWHNEAYDLLVEKARGIKHAADRMQAYREADRIVMQSAAIVPLLYGRRHLLVKPWLRNCVPSPTGRWLWKDVIIEPH